MNRATYGQVQRLLMAMAACTWAASAQADIVVSTINFLAQTPADASGILRYNEFTGTELTLGDVPPFTSAAGPFGLTDIAVGPNGNIFATDPFTSSILQFDGKTGAPIPSPFGPSLPDGLFTAVSAENQFSYTSLAFDQAGNLYAAVEFEKSIHVYGGPNSATPGVLLDTLLDSPSAPVISLSSIAFDSNGDLLVADRGDNKIYRVNVSTDTDSVIIQQPAAELPPYSPAGMAIGPNDDIFLVDLGGSAIMRYDSNGQNGQVFTYIPVLAEDTDGGSFPADIVFDRNGDLLVAVLGGSNVIGSGAGRIVRVDPSGNVVDTIDDLLVPVSGIALIDDLVPGDYDGDGFVDMSDYTEWKAQFGSTVAPFSGADGNGDGLVDLSDYTVWRDTFGATGIDVPVTQTLTAIPEPTSIALCALAMAGTLGAVLRR